ncbi:iron ABC transporter permease [Corynebacterium uropygiale]|uniref:Iron ABC transporter permease n=1 Tax=Corynebacterium uropygiale TaxID=1775911 RepID=A0A9X1QVG9_9CORY|nr:iron chelate uptake ABC transporter family permease subunit [Corynebacterium uropygiale]MCF4007755.1 iron ABC transporter permease [Corynebacterium uropygiale]
MRSALVTLGLIFLAAAVSAVTLWHGSPSEVVVAQLRAPRLAMALVGGAALGVVGVLLQEGLGNPLAVPELLGVSAGAAAVMCGIVVLGLPIPVLLTPVATLLGGLAAGALVWWGARSARSAVEVLLVGSAVAAAANALVIILVGSAGETQLRAILRYLQGSLAELYWPDVRPIIIPLLVLLPCSALFVPVLDILRVGDTTARTLGAHPARLRGLLLLFATLLVAFTVAAAGPLAWIGFLGPLLARLCLPQCGTRVLLLGGALCGAVMTCAADGLAQLAFYPAETPVGGWTGIVAALTVVGLLLGSRARVLGRRSR